MVFADRHEAGEILARKLAKSNLDPSKTLIIAIPRGGILVAEEIATSLNAPLTVLVVKKLGAPANPELAIGATASFGKPVLDRWLMRDLDVSQEYIKKEVATKKKEAKAREKFLNIEIQIEKFKGKTAIVVDDGLATGQTAKMAAKVLKQFKVSKLILAVPCAAPSVINGLKKDYDEVICLEVSSEFMAVGQFYRDFSPVEDEEVKKILNSKN
ncbi:hypothetical protein A3A54_02655 [Candidatus Curtissbacteria bacterium RIFCSPLOWO2_01_FULL_39_62]|uniref:Phosphoribosyltransferase domain-containing protein n=2 Tax=Candidatus Curtissiibacteriota TaxID=1752717 RepID=A0A1F5GBL6_9BACT|nr:MAG: hypothetical protein A2775_01805 [Candidatus Curtissbacteria bacterium RIFCSPHIGHO2_01_FULL_39_57]OGD89246.1 MAG: hypothetical protein A3D04_01255 [Candidatus Curtissbacteria bacterium RIFCSPHIGHO2_02_FULL_40_16b]OGD99322.1 MAG: hypothetical protein A3J17_00780 [Candidatus Curtissbacteria bacterium RIFCSPLOWO2_02_FULL_40_11]OGE01443.1 MAG: hypothetical protein A3A54_02655 [Candidatus Curtissbacteria bacterium RIFCSPLOWO2_01_FULL_39_62]OGE13939.1 MAG: hypothetical protein A3G14_04960 [Ca